MAIREFARTGKVTPRNVGIGATAGAVLSPAFLGIQKVGAMGLNKLFPQLFKNKQMQREVTDVLHGIHKNKYNLNDKQLQNVYNISKDKNIIKLFQDIDGAENVYKNLTSDSLKKYKSYCKRSNDFFSKIGYSVLSIHPLVFFI